MDHDLWALNEGLLRKKPLTPKSKGLDREIIEPAVPSEGSMKPPERLMICSKT